MRRPATGCVKPVTVVVGKAIAGVMAVSVVGLMSQAAQIVTPGSVGPVDWSTQAEHLTLSGAMVIAIAVLWRALVSKDALLIQSTKIVTEALAASASSNAELRKIIEDSVTAKRDLTDSIDSLRREIEHGRGLR